MRKPIQNRVESRIQARPLSAILEILPYALGAGVLFYLVDVLFMTWQGLALH